MREHERYGIDCQNQLLAVHTFQIPPPRLLGTGASPSETAKEAVLVNVLCPQCNHVYAYTSQAVHQRLFRIPDQDLVHSVPICVSVVFVCGIGGCEAPTKVHAMKYGRENIAVVISQLREAIFHVFCRDGHTLRFDQANLIYHDAEPFSPALNSPSLPQWYGWHAFRRGLATNLHRLGVADKEIQQILRHSNISLTQNVYVKSLQSSTVEAMQKLDDALNATQLPPNGEGKAVM